jgi:hypothetical protein
MYNPVLCANKNDRAMELILGALALIMSKKIPAELGLNKTDQMHLKIKVLPSYTGDDRQTSAVLRLTPTVRPISSRSGLNPDDTINSAADMLEVDQEGKAVAMNGRHTNLPYKVPIINQIAAKNVREDFISHIMKHVPDFFKDEGAINGKKILNLADKKNAEREEAYIAEHCNQFELPLFDVPTNSHAFD